MSAKNKPVLRPETKPIYLPVNVSEALHAKIVAKAKEAGATKSDVVRTALEYYL